MCMQQQRARYRSLHARPIHPATQGECRRSRSCWSSITSGRPPDGVVAVAACRHGRRLQDTSRKQTFVLCRENASCGIDLGGSAMLSITRRYDNRSLSYLRAEIPPMCARPTPSICRHHSRETDRAGTDLQQIPRERPECWLAAIGDYRCPRVAAGGSSPRPRRVSGGSAGSVRVMAFPPSPASGAAPAPGSAAAACGVERVGVGILGCGTVGSALLELLAERRGDIAARCGVALDPVAVAVRSPERRRPGVGPRSCSPATGRAWWRTPTCTWSWS